MITLTEVPQDTIKGLISTSVDLAGFSFAPSPVGDRSVGSGTVITNFVNPGFVYGTLTGSLDYLTGVWTAPETAWYDFSILFSLSIAPNPFNALTSVTNPNGFVGNGAPPTNTYGIVATPQTLDFNDYFGRFAVALTDSTGGVLICSNERLLTYDSSSCIISASYTARKVNAGTQLVCRWLNRCTNTIVGNTGNSYHFTATHLRKY